jgi:hypothetical protein
MIHVSDSPSSTPALVPDAYLRTALRLVLVVCQGAAIGLTRELWRGRSAAGEAPNLPIVEAIWIDAAQLDFFWPLLATLAAILIWPRVGVALHCGLLTLAIAWDQMRIQPEFLSVAILLLGTLPQKGPLLVARCHLISLWLFAGIHKLLSLEYLYDSGPRMWHNTVGGLSDRQAFVLSLSTALAELLLGILAIIPRTRRAVLPLAALLHGGILASLILQKWNTAVWPWNVAVIAAAFVLFRNWKEPLWAWPAELNADGSMDKRSRAWQALAGFVLVYPALFYVGIADAYASWCVYASNAPSAEVYLAADVGMSPDADAFEHAAGENLQFRHYDALNVPFPPAERLFLQYFRKTAEPGDCLVIEEPRLLGRKHIGKHRGYVLRLDGSVAAIQVEPK